MPKHEIIVTLKLAEQYLKPEYNHKDINGIKPQIEKEEAVFKAIVGELAKKDQDVLKIWNIVKKKRNGNK